MPVVLTEQFWGEVSFSPAVFVAVAAQAPIVGWAAVSFRLARPESWQVEEAHHASSTDARDLPAQFLGRRLLPRIA
jgi:hypothetical protein